MHVCRRWRQAVHESPLRLDVQLVCKGNTQVKEYLDAFPALPIVISYLVDITWPDPRIDQGDNVTVALGHHNRVCQIHLDGLTSSLLGRLATAMHEPFPVLRHLLLESSSETPPVLPDGFLGGSTPSLRSLDLEGIPFPALARLVISAHNLVSLRLWSIPNTGYVSPETMANALSTLANLRYLVIGFQSPHPCPDRKSRRPPSLIRIALPALTELKFKGVSEYLECFVSRIYAPLLEDLDIKFFNQLNFDTPQLPQFVGHAEALKSPDRAQVFFTKHDITIILQGASGPGRLTLEISCELSDWQLSAVAQVCSQLSRLVSIVGQLDISGDLSWPPVWQDDVDSLQWLELLHPFTSVETMRISTKTWPLVVPALKEITEGGTEILPVLRHLSLHVDTLSSPVQEAVEPLVAARQLSGHPVTIGHWDRERYWSQV